MIKVLEAKYGDYGFFLGWEKDRTFGAFMKTQAGSLADTVQFYYKKRGRRAGMPRGDAAVL